LETPRDPVRAEGGDHRVEEAGGFLADLVGRAKPVPMNIDGVTAVIYAELGFAPPRLAALRAEPQCRNPRARLGGDRSGQAQQGADADVDPAVPPLRTCRDPSGVYRTGLGASQTGRPAKG
jgi:hypothetical protein